MYKLSLSSYFRSLILIFAFVLIFVLIYYVKKTIYKLVLYYFIIKINFGCSITVDSHVTKVHLLQTFLDPQKHDLIDNDVETYLGSHSSEKCVYKRKCVSTLIKGKHDTWLARRLTTYK